MADRKKHVILMGMPGSGKSSLGFVLSKLMRLPFVDTDYYIIKKEQKSVSDIFAKHGEDYFRELEKQILLEIVENEPSVISTGGGMPCFFDNMDIMNEFAVTVYLEVTPEQLFEHLKNDKKRPLVKDKTNEELMDYINTSLMQRKPYYEKADITIRIVNSTPVQLAIDLCEKIASHKSSDTICYE
ncbi:MAG: AAA family ATPase [Prevotellaceae bacterium]|jgi:shikimate kinase|nr:AAA family ATPase [Prevotellaceae bacterium]